jgi:hypothetical protein
MMAIPFIRSPDNRIKKKNTLLTSKTWPEFSKWKDKPAETESFSWINQNKTSLEDIGFIIEQKKVQNKKYFIGESSISIEIRENIDWFDIYAIVSSGNIQSFQ